MEMCDMVTEWDVNQSWNQRQDYWRDISGTLFSVGEESSHWHRLGAFLTFQTFYMYMNLCNTLKKRKKMVGLLYIGVQSSSPGLVTSFVDFGQLHLLNSLHSCAHARGHTHTQSSGMTMQTAATSHEAVYCWLKADTAVVCTLNLYTAEPAA